MTTDGPGHDGSRFYGAVVRVADLAACRTFYAETLGLGPPVVNTSFWVEFQVVPGQMVLTLYHDPAAKARAKAGPANVMWCWQPQDTEATLRRLQDRGVVVLQRLSLPSGGEALLFADPEGNAFLLLDRGPKPLDPAAT